MSGERLRRGRFVAMSASSQGRRVAVVTGHSRGLGHAVTTELRRREIPVLGISRSAAPDPGLRLHEVALDLSDLGALEYWLATDALAEFVAGALTPLLINNAGLLQPIGRLEQQEAGAVGRAVSVNVAAALMLSAAFVRATTDARDRRILHVSSGAGRKPYAGWSVYCATKAALDHHARAVALDRTPRLRIGSVAPGVIDTDMQAEIRATADDHFPDRGRFVRMKEEGTLRAPAEAAKALVDLLLADNFGQEAVTETPR